MSVSLDKEFIEKSEGIITHLGFRDIKSFVKNQALLMMLAKIDKYESEDIFFQKKYGLSFDTFRKRIEGEEGAEVFEHEDDFLDWRFARESLDRLRRLKQEFEHA